MSVRDKILGTNDRPETKVTIPEWDCDVYLRPWTVKEAKEITSKTDIGALVTCLANEDGSLVFKSEDESSLEEKNCHVIRRLINVMLDVNGVDVDAIIKAKNG